MIEILLFAYEIGWSFFNCTPAKIEAVISMLSFILLLGYFKANGCLAYDVLYSWHLLISIRLFKSFNWRISYLISGTTWINDYSVYTGIFSDSSVEACKSLNLTRFLSLNYCYLILSLSINYYAL